MLNDNHFFGVMDCNNFFVSCERVFNPALEGKAVVVLSNNDGCAVSRSAEAKKMGIKMAMPAFKIERELIQNGKEVFFCSSNYTLYADMSRRVMNILREIVENIEQYSIDESFIDFGQMSIEQIKQKGREIVYKVRKYTGIPVSLGVAPTKTLSKAATYFAKRYSGYRGFCMIDNDEKRVKALKLLPADQVWGIGWRSMKKLGEEGIVSAWDFLQKPQYWIKKQMGVNGLKVYNELLGVSVLDLEKAVDKQSITTSRSFGDAVESKPELSLAISNFASSCAEKLRGQNSFARNAIVFLNSNRFHKEDYYFNSTLVEFPEATNSTITIVKSCVDAIDILFRPGVKYKKAGVILAGIVPQGQVQQNLFAESNYPQDQRINQLLDSVNKKYGKNKLHLAIQDGKEGKWKMKRGHLSGNYTTDLNEIIKIKV